MACGCAAFADVAPTEWQAEQQCESSETGVGSPPSGTGDQGLSDDGQEHGAESGTDHDKSEGGAETPIEPGRDGARVGEMCGAVSDQAKNEAREIELPDRGVQRGQRDQSARVYGHAREDDAARAEAIDPASEQRRDQSEGDSGDGETAGDGFAGPAEFCGERFYEDRKRVNEERTETCHHAEAGCEDYAPAVVGEIEFVDAVRSGARQ